MKKIKTKHIVGVLTGIGVVCFLTSWYVHDAHAEYAVQMKLLIAEQSATLISIAEVTDRDGADAIVSAIIQDCAQEDRSRFDTLLGKLSTVNRAELVEVSQLFDSCGNYYSQRKAVMVARLDREYEVYREYVHLLSLVDAKAEKVTYPVEKWEELVTMEGTRSELSSSLVRIQDEIIIALLDNVPIDSEEMLAKISEAQDAQDTLAYTGSLIDVLREDIIGL
jgi:hypothetical protein